MPYFPLISPTTGTATTATCTVDFGFASGGETDTSSTITVAAAWVTGTSILTASPVTFSSTGSAGANADHDPDDTIVEGIVAQVQNVVPGVGFDVFATSTNNSWGRYLINIIGQ